MSRGFFCPQKAETESHKGCHCAKEKELWDGGGVGRPTGARARSTGQDYRLQT